MKERITDYKALKDECIEAIRRWFYENGNGCNAVIGLSGGKDSTIVAKLCVEALGPERVIVVSLPGEGQDSKEAEWIAEEELGLKCMVIPIGDLLAEVMGQAPFEPSEQSVLNLPARFRMMMLYYVAQTYNGRVIGTCNESENYLGYFTKWGDGVSDFEPLAHLTVTEVKKLGYELGISKQWVDKTPDDGLPGSKPDEEKFGFSYELLDEYICDHTSPNVPDDIRHKIEDMHNKSLFKTIVTSSIDSFYPEEVFEYEYGSLEIYKDFMSEFNNSDFPEEDLSF